MNPYLCLILLTVLQTLIAIDIWQRGKKRGYQRGYDTGWVDHQLEMARKDRERRDRKGRFRARPRKGGAQ